VGSEKSLMRIGVEFVEWLGDLDGACGGAGDFIFVQ
jgi:hypothetical protein